MKDQTQAIRILSLTAVVLLAALAFLPSSSPAQTSLKDGDFLASTFPSPTGSDALYVADTRTGMIAVFVYDPAARMLVPRAVRPIADAFAPVGPR
jgi:hypothetical protein